MQPVASSVDDIDEALEIAARHTAATRRGDLQDVHKLRTSTNSRTSATPSTAAGTLVEHPIGNPVESNWIPGQSVPSSMKFTYELLHDGFGVLHQFGEPAVHLPQGGQCEFCSDPLPGLIADRLAN